MSSSMGRIIYPIYEMENNPFMFQTTNQSIHFNQGDPKKWMDASPPSPAVGRFHSCRAAPFKVQVLPQRNAGQPKTW